jgi:aminoglycoside phosphotransferase (APT) family kinase protein
MTLDQIDQPKAVRAGEELDLAKLEAYLSDNLPNFHGPIVVDQFPSGFSNLTYLLRAGDQELVLRRPPFGAQAKGGHDMSREYRILSHLIDVYPKVPRPLVYTEDTSVIGAPFYVMERLKGLILRSSKAKEIGLSADAMRQLSEALVDALADLHHLDYTAAGLADLGKPDGYVRRQVEGWIERYRKAQTDEIAAMDQIAEWMPLNMPPEKGAALIHNDFKYDNLVLDPADPSRIIGVLDWEMATLGDPMMDLGTTLAYWVDPDDTPELQALAFVPTFLPGNLNRAQIADRYAAATGAELSDMVFYFVFGLFKLGVIAQQIYARYKQGFTKDERFGALIHGVRAVSATGVKALDKGRIANLND